MDKKNPSQVDLHVGKRLRARRQELKLSQEALAEELGITFQQVQKYERGSNRISAGRLFQLARCLRTTIPYFYDGAEGTKAKGVAEDAAAFPVTMDPETLKLVTAFQSITDPAARRKIVNMVKKQAAIEADDD